MLISCPECNEKVSDKAHVCPHCGFRIDTLTKCPDCGRLVRPGTVACPDCGYPFSMAGASSEGHEVSRICPECGGILSGNVQTCPHCGAPVSSSDHVKKEHVHSTIMKSDVEETPPITRSDAEMAARASVPKDTVPLPMASPAGSETVSAGTPTPQESVTTRINRGTKRVCYYVLKGLVYGPTSANELYERILDGRLPWNVRVWMQGSSHWAPATDYTLLNEKTPDAADLQWQDSLVESDACPPMNSSNGRALYRYASEPDETAPYTYIGVTTLIGSLTGPHPWIRYFARMFDLYSFVIVAALVAYSLGFSLDVSSSPLIADFAGTIAAIVLWVPLESLWLYLCGTTPGKWLLGVSVRSTDGTKLSYRRAFQRSLLVATEGWGLGIPVLSLVTLIRGSRILESTNTTPWDLQANTTVHHRALPMWGLLIYIVAAAGYIYVFYLGSSATR